MRKWIHILLGFSGAFALMITLLITSVEAVTYWTPGYYEKEYRKYHVLEAVQMEMEDLLDVTDEMMSYLRGGREDLHVLFLGAIAIRRGCVLVILAVLALLFLTRADIRYILPRTVCAGTILFFALLAILAAIISSDFSMYFIVFHHIFFNNDLWMLDPSTDLLINIVPEPFFMDTAARIGITYGISVAAVFSLCLAGIFLTRRKNSFLQHL